MTALCRYLAIAGLALLPIIALAQHESGQGYPFDMPRERQHLSDREPTVSFPISDIDADSQRLINSAVELIHGFWTYEAERSIREVIARNPKHPMPLVLAAFFQTVFGAGDYERADAYFKQAKNTLARYSAPLSEQENQWFAAISPLFDANLPSNLRDLAHLERLEQLVATYPNDLEAKAFLALGNWLFKVNRTPNEAERRKIRAATDLLIEEVLASAPNHPVHHYKIHLWNNGRDDFRALDSARASGPAQPQTAHLWHMPAHIFANTYDDYYALRQVEIAHRVDHKQMLERRIMPTNVHNYYHNYRDFALRLKADSGQSNDAIANAMAMLRFGRLAHKTSRTAMVTLAAGSMRQIERFQLWSKFSELHNRGYFNHLSTGEIEIDREHLARVLRIRIRSLTANDAVFAENRMLIPPLIRQIERLSNDAAGSSSYTAINAMFEDSRLWYEIAMRRGTQEVPDYYLAKLEALQLTPLSQILLLALQFENETAQQRILKALSLAPQNLSLTDHLDMLSFYLQSQERTPVLASMYRDAAETAELEATKAITPPVSILDLQGMALAASHPHVATRIISNAERRHQERLANTPPELKYLEEIDLNAMGPSSPQHYEMNTYTGDEPTIADALTTPEPARYKLFVFAVGTSCEACNQQLLALNAARPKLTKMGIEIFAITQTGEIAHEIPTIADTDFHLHKMFGVWDQFTDRGLHGLYLIDSKRTLLWDSTSEHPVIDIDFLLEEFARMIRLN